MLVYWWWFTMVESPTKQTKKFLNIPQKPKSLKPQKLVVWKMIFLFNPFLVGGWATHLKNMLVKIWFIFPKFRGENSKNVWNHHLVFISFFLKMAPPPPWTSASARFGPIWPTSEFSYCSTPMLVVHDQRPSWHRWWSYQPPPGWCIKYRTNSNTTPIPTRTVSIRRPLISWVGGFLRHPSEKYAQVKLGEIFPK